MPKLSPLYWMILVLLLFFDGFTVFALTRDYYLRHPSEPLVAAPTATAPPRTPQPTTTSAIPDAVIDKNPELLLQRANNAFGAQRFAEAAQDYRRLIELNPDDAELYNNLGLALHYSGDNTGAIETLQLAVSKDAAQQRPWLSLGFILLQSGNPSEAKPVLEKGRDLAPESEIGKEATRLLGVLESL